MTEPTSTAAGQEWRNMVDDLMDAALKNTGSYAWTRADIRDLVTIDGQLDVAGLEALAKILREHPYYE